MTPLVGRDAELVTLLAAVDHASAGTPSVVVLDGDAGVGKTRLLGELVTAANERGVLSLIGHCVDLGDAPPPYLPFTEAFGRFAAERPDHTQQLLAAHPAIARLLPRRTSADRAQEDRVDRGELFESVMGALAFPTDEQPVLLVVEDVHWADQATRDLLGFLFTRLSIERVAIVVSFRSDDLHRRHPLRPALAEWSRLPNVERLHLEPLGSDEVRALVRSLHSAPMAEPDVRSIVTRADGNAFFAEELVAAAEQCADAEHLPWQLADLLLVRLDRLSDEAREVVRVAAVGGRRVTHDTLASVLDLPGSTLDAALRDAVDAHILESTPSGRGYTFRHALLAEAVYDDLLPGERVRIHSAYAAVLAKRDDGSAAELARHARASHDLATAFEASVRAGDEAMAVAAPQEALNHYQTALELAPTVASAPADPAPLVLAVVDAAVAAGRFHRGMRLAREALDTAPPDLPDSARARLLYAYAVAAVAGEGDDEALRATTEAVRLVPAEPPDAFRTRLVALHARACLIMGRDIDAERWAREAIATAEAMGTPRASADAEITLAMLEMRADKPDEAAGRLRALADEARAAGEAAAELRTRYNLGSLYYEHGDLALSQASYELAAQRAREIGRPWTAFGMDARAMTGLIQYVRGDWDAALRTLDVTGEPVTSHAEALYAATGLAVRAARGDRGVLDLLPVLRAWWDRESRVALYSVGAALELYEVDGQVDDALALLEELVATLTVLWQNPWFLARLRLSAQGLAVLSSAVSKASQSERAALVDRGAVLLADARHSLEHGLPEGRKLGVEGRAWLARLEAEWARLRWLAGVDPPGEDEHVAAWQQAVAGFQYGNVVELERSRARLAAVLRAAGRGAEAAEQASLAREVARQLRAEPLLDEIRALGLSAAPVRSAGGSDALTSRERGVLALLVEGRTNRQIAQQLYISEKTVSVHVSNILAKLDVGSRTEAAALARRDGLLA
ncbi:MAG: transcriptional regulator, LuxR family [Pseudonocardiales bacterium]|nr:transcriptional regulator, LuxR family [Pseudonocardiales bacterium]